eukprot:m.68226 g.68226  ORF g.68226 m.68226 type:complete len:54 (+) comp12191_c1_seq1:1471-1632(+)
MIMDAIDLFLRLQSNQLRVDDTKALAQCLKAHITLIHFDGCLVSSNFDNLADV